MIKKEGERWCVYDSAGKKRLGCHPTKAAAQRQLRAVEANKAKKVLAEYLMECEKRLTGNGNE